MKDTDRYTILVLLWRFMVRNKYICLRIIINITSCVLNDNAICLYFLDGVCQNKHFEKPTRSEFQVQMREALRMSKERHRSRSRKKTVPRAGGPGIDRNLWNDEASNASSTDQEPTND